MRFHVLTIFPEVFPGPLGVGVVGRAIAAGALSLTVHDLRDHTDDVHRQVDDAAFGGRPGMVLKPEPLVRAVRVVGHQPEVAWVVRELLHDRRNPHQEHGDAAGDDKCATARTQPTPE